MLSQAHRQSLALVLTLVLAATGYGQATFGPPAAGPSLAAAPAVGNAPALPAPAAVPPLWKCGPDIPPASIWPVGHAAQCSTGPAACAPFEDRNGPLLIGDPLLDNPPATPGWLGAVELAGVVPHVKNRLTESVALSDGTVDTVHLPTTNLGARVMPRIELGYRWGQATGELTVAYRFIVADGSQTLSPAALPAFAPFGAALRSRLDVQVLDVDYGSYEPSLGPAWDMKWRVGARGVMNYSDSRASGGGVFQQTTNRYWGIGPHASLDLRRWVGTSGFALFGRVDTSLPWGRLAQGFVDTTPAATGEARFFQNMPILTLNFQLGVSWTPCRTDCFRVTAGYTWEHWWDVGALGVVTNFTREEMNIQGGFVRAEWNY